MGLAAARSITWAPLPPPALTIRAPCGTWSCRKSRAGACTRGGWSRPRPDRRCRSLPTQRPAPAAAPWRLHGSLCCVVVCVQMVWEHERLCGVLPAQSCSGTQQHTQHYRTKRSPLPHTSIRRLWGFPITSAHASKLPRFDKSTNGSIYRDVV